jgi:2-hydroxy-4-carboxymuconate semialdehyde hemiacetal dehydrogenase
MHAAQSIACLKAGKHVQVEIPLADRCRTRGVVALPAAAAGRDGGPHAPLQPEPPVGAPADRPARFSIQQMDVQTYFFRRTNMNALGQARSWTDHLLWHHAAHTVDLFAYQTGGDIVQANAVQGPIHPDLGASRWTCRSS